MNASCPWLANTRCTALPEYDSRSVNRKHRVNTQGPGKVVRQRSEIGGVGAIRRRGGQLHGRGGAPRRHTHAPWRPLDLAGSDFAGALGAAWPLAGRPPGGRQSRGEIVVGQARRAEQGYSERARQQD